MEYRRLYPLTKTPDRLNIERKHRKIYEKILKGRNPLSRKNGFRNKHIFILAMCIGYHNDITYELETKEGYILADYLSKEDETIIYSIAAEVGGLKALIDLNEVYKIAEQYAKGGITLLNEEIKNQQLGSYSKKLESDLIKEVDKIDFS